LKLAAPGYGEQQIRRMLASRTDAAESVSRRQDQAPTPAVERPVPGNYSGAHIGQANDGEIRGLWLTCARAFAAR